MTPHARGAGCPLRNSSRCLASALARDFAHCALSLRIGSLGPIALACDFIGCGTPRPQSGGCVAIGSFTHEFRRAFFADVLDIGLNGLRGKAFFFGMRNNAPQADWFGTNRTRRALSGHVTQEMRVPWNSRFIKPIVPAKGRPIATLKDALDYISALPPSEQSAITQEIADAVQMAAQGSGPLRVTEACMVRLVHGPVAIADEVPAEQPAVTRRGRPS